MSPVSIAVAVFFSERCASFRCWLRCPFDVIICLTCVMFSQMPQQFVSCNGASRRNIWNLMHSL